MWSTCGSVCGKILDILFPPSERSARLQKDAGVALSSQPRTTLKQGIPIVSLAVYEGKTKDAIGALKFEHNANALSLLSHLLDDFLIEEVLDRALEDSARSYAIPVPLSAARVQERGYNQVALFVEHTRAVRDSFVVYKPDTLVRTTHTKPQATLPREKRLTNVRGAFAVSKEARHTLHGAHVFLIDDVITTGATLSEAAKTLSACGARVTPVALARA